MSSHWVRDPYAQSVASLTESTSTPDWSIRRHVSSSRSVLRGASTSPVRGWTMSSATVRPRTRSPRSSLPPEVEIVIDRSERSLKRDWRRARAFLQREMTLA